MDVPYYLDLIGFDGSVLQQYNFRLGESLWTYSLRLLIQFKKVLRKMHWWLFVKLLMKSNSVNMPDFFAGGDLLHGVVERPTVPFD